MRFSYAESMTDPSYYLPLARAAEEAGFDSMVVPDSICYPLESDSINSIPIDSGSRDDDRCQDRVGQTAASIRRPRTE